MIKLQVLCGILPKIQEFLPSRCLIGDENDALSQFQSFEEKGKGEFHNLNLKMMRNKPQNTNVPFKYADWM